MRQQRTFQTNAPPELLRRRRTAVLLTMLLGWLHFAAAQDFIVNGTMTNTGTIRVKNQAIVTQPAFGGELVLTGSDQTLFAKQYDNVRLSGTGTKTTSGGNFSVQKNLTIAAPVTLTIQQNAVITLGDTLFETGRLKGAIQKTVDLSGAATTSDFGGIGATVTWNASAPGTTTIMRVSDSTKFGDGNQSIRRYYEIQLSDATKTGTVTFKYADDELNGHDVQHLQLWRSTDNGANWVRQIPVVDTLLKTLTKENVGLKGWWTAADTLRPLGPLQGAAGIPAMIAQASILDTMPVILTTLDSFKVQITDVFGTPVANVPVKFAVTKQPTELAGGSLSVLLDSTDDQGIASTVFTLGTKVGAYEVIATAENLDTVRLKTTARHGAAQSIAELTISPQTKPILTALDSAYRVQVFDIGGNAVESALVKFVIDSIPSSFAVDQVLSPESAYTNASGIASTILTLGTKVGTYGVRAVISGVNDTARFYATAVAGPAAAMLRGSGNDQVGIVGTSVAPFMVTLLDVGDNPVPNEPVTFSIASFPAGSDTGRLSSTTIQTDALGTASTILTLGTKIGSYIVSAQNTTSGGSLSYSVTAEPAAPHALAEVSGADQIAPILTALPNDFVLAVRDTFDNPVDSVMVRFTIDSLLANGAGARLSVDSLLTDGNGHASTRLTFGYRSGGYRVNASVNDVPVLTFQSTAAAGAAVAMAPADGAFQSDTILTGLERPLSVRLTDIGGNGVPLKNVQFHITERPAGDTSAVLSASSGTTDSSGVALTALTLGSKVGTYKVKAVVSTPMVSETDQIDIRKRKSAQATAVIETTFTATAVHGAAAVMQPLFGDRQVNPTETTLDTAFVVTLRDRGNNPVPNDTVRFAVVSAPANATLQTVTDSVVVTDSNGVAMTFLALGTREGLYTVRATSRSLPAAEFSASAYLIYGDINKDISINIGDITALVDILRKELIPTASDSLKADFNRDGLIDTLDIATIRETILDRSIFSTAVQPAAFLEESNTAGYIASPMLSQPPFAAGVRTVLEATRYGLRVNLTNDAPVRGIELRLHMKDSTLTVNRANMIFDRAEMMNVFVSTRDQEVRVVAYNLTNTPIMPDSGSLFRLPSITSLDMIDSTEVTIALNSNAAAPAMTEKVSAPADAYPVTFRLSQNYPNPFNGSTTIEYDIPDGTERTRTVIQVFNLLGQRIKTLVSEEQQPGRYTVRWDGTDQYGVSVASGVYFYRLVSKTHVGSRKMLYVK